MANRSAGSGEELVSPPSGTTIRPGVLIEINVTDSDLGEVTFRLDNGPAGGLSAPYEVDTSGWSDGTHTLEVAARDLAGTVATARFSFRVASPFGWVVLLAGILMGVLLLGILLVLWSRNRTKRRHVRRPAKSEPRR